MATNSTVWAFDLGKGSIGEAVRHWTKFLHKASLLIPADFAETKTAANRRRMWRTRQAHKAREEWLRVVMRQAGVEVLYGRNYDAAGNWKPGASANERLEREFAKAGDSTCYTSCLLRIKLLRGERLESWQIFKALFSAIQRRGYDPDIPWRTRQQRNGGEEEGVIATRMQEFEMKLAQMAGEQLQYRFPCYYDAWRMGLWNPARPEELKERLDCHATTTRNEIVPRRLVEKEVEALVEAAAKQVPALRGKAMYVLYGPAGKAYASFYKGERKAFGLHEGGKTDWQGVLGQKIPRFDNRIIGKCVLIPRLNVCKIRKGTDGDLHPNSKIVAETVFLMKLKNMRLQANGAVRGLTAKEIGEIFCDPKRQKFGLRPTQWKKWCGKFGGRPMPGQHEEVSEPSFSGRSRFCRPALEIMKRVILSGDAPAAAYARELAALSGNADPLKGLVPADLEFLKRMGDSWDKIYVPNQKLEALEKSAEDNKEAIRRLIGSQNDPVVRHRLTLFAQRLNELAEDFGEPDFVVLEFVREDFMGEKARNEYLKFQRDRAKERAKAREEAAQAGAAERSSGLKMELLKAQLGECLYRPEDKLIPERLDEYVIDHIVPRAKGGPDAMVNYALTTRRTNDDKGDRTPFEWMFGKPGWDAYVERVKKRTSSLRNKKVQLLTSPDAETLVQKYTALVETAWISKLAQTIIGLRFGWPGGICNGQRRVTVVSGGLTGRIRRKYKLNSLLNPDAKTEEEAELKNRDDDRHHALDAMVISFIPNWARNQKLTEFFKFPDGVHREFFRREIDEVVPRNVAFEKPTLEETLYGSRSIGGKRFVVGRELLMDFAVKLVAGKRVLKKRADIDTNRIVDGKIRRDVKAFLDSQPGLTLQQWEEWAGSYKLTANGPRVVKIATTRSKADSLEEYKDLSKDRTGQLRRGAKHQGYFVCDVPAPTKKDPSKQQILVRPVYVHESKAKVTAQLSGKIHGYFESGCSVRLKNKWVSQGKEYPAGEFICLSIWADGRAKLRHPKYGEIGPVGLRALLDAGFQRV